MDNKKIRNLSDDDLKLLFAAMKDEDVNIWGELAAKSYVEKGGANPDVRDPFTEDPALTIACKSKLPDTAKYLAGVVKDVNAKDLNDEVPLIYAIKYNCYQAAATLVKRGATLQTDNEEYGCFELRYLRRKESSVFELFDALEERLNSASKTEKEDDLQRPFVLFNKETMEKALDDEKIDRRKRYLKLLVDSGDRRGLADLKNEMIKQVEALRDKFPNFSEVIDFYLRQLSLCSLPISKVIKLPPVLLAGPAGIGKTRFASELANVLDLPFTVIACGTTTSGFVLAGNSASWNDSQPGQIAKTLIDIEVANPIMLLDEVDKMGGDYRYDPMGPLYSLLEENTARKFMDEFIELPMDCSAINWIATANDLNRIPDPILSRFVVINVREPNKDEMKAITRSIYQDITDGQGGEWGGFFSDQLDDGIINKLTGVAPRKIKQLLIDACGRAAQRDPDADPLTIDVDDLELTVAKGKASIGFLN